MFIPEIDELCVDGVVFFVELIISSIPSVCFAGFKTGFKKVDNKLAYFMENVDNKYNLYLYNCNNSTAYILSSVFRLLKIKQFELCTEKYSEKICNLIRT